MSEKLLEIFKKNSQELNFMKVKLEEMTLIKERLVKMETEIEYLKSDNKLKNEELKLITNKSYYIDKYLENLQDSEIELIQDDEKIDVSDS
jgi:hypothetical protein